MEVHRAAALLTFPLLAPYMEVNITFFLLEAGEKLTVLRKKRLIKRPLPWRVAFMALLR